MVKINKVAHVVLNVRDPEASAKWYADLLEMELMHYSPERQWAFLSFGEQHHDIALFKLPEGTERGAGLHHIALQVNGGDEELRQIYTRLLSRGVELEELVDFEITHSIFFYDPDGNRIEVYCEKMSAQDAREHMRSVRRRPQPLKLEPVEAV